MLLRFARNDCAPIGFCSWRVLPSKHLASKAAVVSTVIARCEEVVELFRCVAPKQSAV